MIFFIKIISHPSIIIFFLDIIRAVKSFFKSFTIVDLTQCKMNFENTGLRFT